MRTFRLSLVVGLIVVMSICAGEMTSSADNYSGGHYRGRGRDGSHHGGYYWGGRGSSYGVVIGGPYWGASWYSPYYYPYYSPYYPYAPAVTVPSRQQEYIEQPRDKSSPRPSGVWYFCPESNTYYPYVRECQGGWQTVPAQPPSETGR